jgi:hypothetical protein
MAITLRTQKGSELTYEEVDENFSSTIYSGSIIGNTLTLHYTASEFSPSNLVLPIISSSYAITSSITTAILGTEGYVTVFTGHRTQGDSPIYVDGGRVGVGDGTMDKKAILDLDTTKAGFLPPRMETSEMKAISDPPQGLMVYNTDEGKIAVYNGSWRLLSYV